jgi:two-component system, OmpR family, alkaline phosphatase synthesis response regulator PhoP
MSEQAAKILIADDHPEGAELIEAYLDGAGWEVRTAGDGDATMKAVHEWKPDVLLLDIMMPKLSGFEVCKRLRADAATRDLPILMITALDQPSDVDRAVEAGTNDYLTKPINKTDLVMRVKALLQSRRQTTDLDRTIEYVDEVTKVSA